VVQKPTCKDTTATYVYLFMSRLERIYVYIIPLRLHHLHISQFAAFPGQLLAVVMPLLLHLLYGIVPSVPHYICHCLSDCEPLHFQRVVENSRGK